MIISTTSEAKLLEKIRKMELRHSTRSYIFSHIRMTSPNGSIYILRQHLNLHSSDSTDEPNRLWDLVKDM